MSSDPTEPKLPDDLPLEGITAPAEATEENDEEDLLLRAAAFVLIPILFRRSGTSQ